MTRIIVALLCCLALGGCYVEAGGHYHEHYDGCGCESEYVVGFTASVIEVGSYAPSTYLECACDTSVELALTLRNDGPWDDVYHADGGYPHRFLVYDDWGHLVWDSWVHHHDNGLHQHWDLPVGATLTLSETWDLTDDLGYALPAGIYHVEARFTGELEAGRTPPPAAPIVIEILPGGIG